MDPVFAIPIQNRFGFDFIDIEIRLSHLLAEDDEFGFFKEEITVFFFESQSAFQDFVFISSRCRAEIREL